MTVIGEARTLSNLSTHSIASTRGCSGNVNSRLSCRRCVHNAGTNPGPIKPWHCNGNKTQQWASSSFFNEIIHWF